MVNDYFTPNIKAEAILDALLALFSILKYAILSTTHPLTESGARVVYHDLNLAVPFHAGDIVTVDCRPFVPLSHGGHFDGR